MPAPRILRRRASGGSTPTLLQQFRQDHPEYKDWSDKELADGLYQKYYSTGQYARSQEQFYQELGLGPPPPPVDQGTDLQRSAARGAVRTILNVPGLPGNMMGAAEGTNRAMGLQPPKPGSAEEEVANDMVGTKPLVTLPRPPTTQDMVNAGPKALQGVANYEPQTSGGRMLDEGLELLGPTGVLSGATKVPKMIGAGVKLGVIPGALGEGAAEAVPEPYKGITRFLVNMVGGVGTSSLSDLFRAPGAASRAAELLTTFQRASQSQNPAVRAAVTRLNGGHDYSQNPQQLIDDREILRAAYAADNPAGASSRITPNLVTGGPTLNAKVNQIQMAVARNVGAGRKGPPAQQYQGAFADLDRKLTLADTKDPNHGLSQLFTPGEREIIRRLASGSSGSWSIDQLSRLGGWKTIAAALGLGLGAGFTARGLQGLTDASFVEPILGLVGVTSATGRLAQGAERVAQGQDMRRLLGSATGLPKGLSGGTNPFTLGSYAGTPAGVIPSDMQDRYDDGDQP